MPDKVIVFIDQRAMLVPAGITVAAALSRAGAMAVRRSRTGEPRGPLCGMGICHECRVTIDGVAHRRSCQIPCSEGMRISTDA
jgi:predicted molibdopterin-dependent oxidoreductase YjgC